MGRRSLLLLIAALAAAAPEEQRSPTSALTQLIEHCKLDPGLLGDDDHHEQQAPLDPSSLEFFTHIPLSGGTAWSWHLMATHTRDEIVPGSAVAASFRLPSSCPKVRYTTVLPLPIPSPPPSRPSPPPPPPPRPQCAERVKRELALSASNRSYRVLYAHAKASLLTELGVQRPFHTTTFLRDARTLALANGPRRRAINAVLVKQCRLLATNATNCSVARGVAAAQAHAHTRKYAEDDKDHDGNRWCDAALTSAAAGDVGAQPQNHERQLFGRERRERKAHGRNRTADRRRHQQRYDETWLSWLVSDTADGDGDRHVCESFVSAQRALRRTLWFGMTSQWAGSVCTYHSLTKRRFPKEDAAVCPGRMVGGGGDQTTRGRGKGQGNEDHGVDGSVGRRALYGRGNEPSAHNDHSTCPLPNAEAMLERSPAKLAVEVIESSTELSDLLAPLLEGEAALAALASLARPPHIYGHQQQTAPTTSVHALMPPLLPITPLP